MAQPNTIVEIGFDIPELVSGPYLYLDDAIKGTLDTETNILAGSVFADVTNRVKTVSIRRGKSRQLDRYSAGACSITLDNNDRAFDPTYENSPFYGQVIPRREVRITSNGVTQYFGLADDWNLAYQPNGANTAIVECSDGFRILANQTLPGGTATAQLSGDRVNAILDSAAWPSAARNIETGQQTLGADVISPDTNVLGYLQLVESSEPGAFFIDKSGNITFKDRNLPGSTGAITLADDGSGIPYVGIEVVYGSELLYNEVVISSAITNGTAVASNEVSQITYGIQNLTQTGLLMDSTSAAQDLANWYATKYANPEFRFESVSVLLNNLTESEQNQILGLELGDVVKVIFTPGNPPTGPAIEKYAEIIRLDQQIDISRHTISIGFATLDTAFLVLDDAVFGRLEQGNALSF